MTASGGTRVVRYDAAALHRELLAVLEGFLAAIRSPAVGPVLGEEILAQSSRQMEEIRSRLDTELRLVVVGDFKRGKSTLLNALLGTQLLATDVAPETVTINEIRYGPELTVEACLDDGGRVGLQAEDLAARHLVPLLAQLARPVSHLDIRLPLPWLERLCVVDTPGTGDVLWQFDQKVQEYLFRADAVVFVVSALSPLAESERAFLRISVLPQDFPKVIFVLNLLDKIREEPDVDRLTHAVAERIGKLMPSATVFPLSAFDELCRVQSLERPRPDRASSLAAAFAAFRTHLEQTVLLHRGTIQVDRATGQANRMLQGFEAKIGLLRQALDAEAEGLRKAIVQGEEEGAELRSRIEERRAAAGARVRDLATEACGWLGAFLDRLETETLARLDRFRAEDLQRHFGFFLMDNLCLAVGRCLEAHRPVLAEIVSEARGKVVEEAQSLLAPFPIADGVARTAAGFTFGDSPWTRLETFQALVHSLQSRLCSLAAELLLRQDGLSKERRQALSYRQRLQSSLPALRHELEAQVSALYGELAARIEQQMGEIWQEEVSASLAAVRQARELATAAVPRRAANGEALAAALRAAGEARAALASLDRKLWAQQLVEIGTR